MIHLHHACQCAWCEPRLKFPTPPPPSFFHSRMPAVRQFPVRVYLDGRDMSDTCFGADAGEQGRVWLFRPGQDGHPHACQTCRKGICTDLLTGTVQIVGRLSTVGVVK